MPVSNASYELSTDEQAIVLFIENTPDMLEKLYKGLFTVARRHLGYKSRTSSAPFTTRSHSASALRNSQHERNDLTFCENNHIVCHANDSVIEGSDTLTLSMIISNTFVYDAVSEINLSLDKGDKMTPWNHNLTAIGKALIADKWDDMVIFANAHRHYMSSWESYSYDQRQQQLA